MTTEVIPNQASSTLSGAIDNLTTTVTIPITARDSFPQSGRFRILVDNELMYVSAGNGTGAGNFTATRATDASTIASHSSGAAVWGVVTKTTMYSLLDNAPPSSLPASTTWYVPQNKQVTFGAPITLGDASVLDIEGSLVGAGDGCPLGELDYVPVTSSNQTITSSVFVDITGLTSTVFIQANRIVAVNFNILVNLTGTTDSVVIGLFEGATQLDEGIITLPAGGFASLQCTARLTPTYGWHTYKLQGKTASGQTFVTQYSTLFPAWIQPVDLGRTR